MKFFETIRDLLIDNLIEKKADLKESLELISKYSNNSLVKNLSVPEKLFLYETKRVFDYTMLILNLLTLFLLILSSKQNIFVIQNYLLKKED